MYIPTSFNLQEILNMLKQEYALTQNVKSRVTRGNVLDALEKTMNHLRQFRQTPKNGLVIFCGNVSEKEGQNDIKLWSIEPIEPLYQKMYWCDQTFSLDPLKEMIREKEIYGAILIDTSGSDIGFLTGKRVSLEKHVDSLVPGKTTKGGWSQQRYARIREDAKIDHMKKTAEMANDILKQQKDLKGIIIGGPGPLKEKFVEGEYLDHELRKKLLGVVDTSYMDIQGMEEAFHRGEHLIQEAAAVKEKHLMQKFFTHLQKEDGLAVYGLDAVNNALNFGAVDVVVISEIFDWVKMKLRCQCGTEHEKEEKPHTKVKCPNCGAVMNVESEEELTEIISQRAKNMGSEVEIISIGSREGEQLKQIGGIGAILRFRV